MPPRRNGRNRPSTQTTAFGRAYPNLQRALILSCDAGPFLLIATIATGAGVWKRPMWQRAMLWHAALWSFLSRWILVGCAVTWSWNEWGRVENREEREEREQRGEQDGERARSRSPGRRQNFRDRVMRGREERLRMDEEDRDRAQNQANDNDRD